MVLVGGDRLPGSITQHQLQGNSGALPLLVADLEYPCEAGVKLVGRYVESMTMMLARGKDDFIRHVSLILTVNPNF